MSVVDVLTVAGGRPGDLAAVADGEHLSFQALDARVHARAARLAEEGVVPGGLVPLRVAASLESAVDLLALWRHGAVPVPLNEGLTDAEGGDARRRLEGVTPPRGTQVVLWTSGTSGKPRGVALSWSALEASARASARRLSLGRGDVWMASLSPAHVGGLALLTRALVLGSAFAVPGGRDTATLAQWLYDGGGPEAQRPTHLSLVPTQLHRLLDHVGERDAPPQLSCVLVGGAHAPSALVARAVSRGWPVALTYGATEMSSQIATAPPDDVRHALETGDDAGSVGRPLDGVEVRVDASGELLTRGATRALGYVSGAPDPTDAPRPVGESRRADEPDATDESAPPGGPDPLADGEGWYHTGDLGRVDEAGRVWITGRRMDRIVSGGVTVDAVEVEEALRAHPSVVDACVVGIPDEEWGERVGAWVVPVHGELDLEALDAHGRARLAPAKRPRLWHVDATLPRNANGKVDRARVRAVLAAGRG